MRSVKHHLLRVVGEHVLTYEELSTVLIEIEVCLNSRPLWPASDDPDDLHTGTVAGRRMFNARTSRTATLCARKQAQSLPTTTAIAK